MHHCKILILCLVVSIEPASAEDWTRFRGPNGSGVTSGSNSLPSKWSTSENLAWKTRLPGPGASSPIIVDGKVFVTAYSGYGVTREQQSELDDLVRHLICVDLSSGKILWQRDVKAWLPEDSYYQTGVSSHGYASHTPCSDGTSVFCFFGKGGVHAFDTKGTKLWQADAGKESDPPKWGSSSSPVLYNQLLIVTAAAESQSIIAFDKTTGEIRWQRKSTGLDGMWGTPILMPFDSRRTDLVMLVPGELWGLDPENGRSRWQTNATESRQAYTSVISHNTTAYASSGQGGGSLALRLALRLIGNDQVDQTKKIWTSPVFATYSSPVYHKDKLYIISRGILSVLDADDGERREQIRLPRERITGNKRFGSLDYASPIVVGDRLFYLNASGQTYVFDLDDPSKPLSVNEVTDDQEVFWGSPAVSNGYLVMRSSKHLYCIADRRKVGERNQNNLDDAASLKKDVLDTK